MARAEYHIWDSTGWRKVVAILGAAYCLVWWVLPIAAVFLSGGLPYLQERPFLERLAISAAGTAVLVAAMVIAFPERLRIYRESTPWKTATNVFWVALGLAGFTWTAAFWGGNLFGALAKLMPGTQYSAHFTISEVDTDRRSTRLTLTPIEGTKTASLTLSRMLFGRPELGVGDDLILEGKRTSAGVYIRNVRWRRKAGARGRGAGGETPAAPGRWRIRA